MTILERIQEAVNGCLARGETPQQVRLGRLAKTELDALPTRILLTPPAGMSAMKVIASPGGEMDVVEDRRLEDREVVCDPYYEVRLTRIQMLLVNSALRNCGSQLATIVPDSSRECHVLAELFDVPRIEERKNCPRDDQGNDPTKKREG